MLARLAVPLVAGVLACAIARGAAAQTTRVVLVAEVLIDGRAQPAASLETAAQASLGQREVRLVELDAAQKAQSLLLSNSLEQGKVPHALTVLNADAALSIRLRCDRSAQGMFASQLLAYYCVLGCKVVRLDTGDVIWSESAELTGHGLNPAMAVESILKTRARELLREQAGRWLAKLIDAAQWDVDLVVTRLSDRTTASALAARLLRLPGLSAAQLVVWSQGTAKYTLSGHGKLALEQLADGLDRDPDLALTVTYQVARALHAEYDFAKAYRRKVMVMSIADLGPEQEELGPQVVSAALMNLPYLELAHSRPLLATKETEAVLSARLREKAKGLGVPLLLSCRLVRRSDGWGAGIRLLHVESGRTVAQADGEGKGVAEATDRAVHVFDERFRAALSRASTRARLGLESATVLRGSASGLVIEGFRIPENPLANGTRATEGRLALRNASNEPISELHLTLEAAGKRVLAQDLATLPARATRSLSIPLAEVAVDADGFTALGATVTYLQGERRGIASAFASLVAAPQPAPAVQAASAKPEYAALMEAGSRAAREGRWEDAHAAFLHAHELEPSALTLRALGLTEFDLGARASAQERLRAALVHPVRPLSGEQRREVELALAHLQ